MYQVIARTWRPQRFSEVIGQSHVTRTLQNAIRLNRIGHGYIFSGQRGTGKTTIARLLAKALNCQRGPAPEPCGECDSCREIAAGRSVDVIEIDAATNRGIDSVRELRENARYAPARDRYKVFIIDEAHQITTEGFNALLKTLEEPPPHVIFLLATTEVHQFPETILSRCQHFALHALPFSDILAQLEKVCAAEQVEADPEALAVLAKSGEGSLRDALSRLEQAIAAFGNRLEGAEVQRFLGQAPSSLVAEVFNAVKEHQRERMLDVVESLIQDGYQLIHFCSQLIHAARNLLVIRVAGPEPRLLDVSAEETSRLVALAEGFAEETLMRCLEILLQLYQQLRFSMDPRFQMELGLLKLVDADRLVAIEELLARSESAPDAPVRSAANVNRSSVAGHPAPPGGGIRRSPAPKASVTPTPLEQYQLRKRGVQDASKSAVAQQPSPEGPVSPEANSAAGIPAAAPRGAEGQEQAWVDEVLRQVEEQSRHMLATILSQAKSWELRDTEVRIDLGDERLAKVVTESDRQHLENFCATILGRKVKVSFGAVQPSAAAVPSSRVTARQNQRARKTGVTGAAEKRVREDPEVMEFEKLFGKPVTVIRDYKE